MDNYIVSARKYRPATFKDVVGQKALTTTLKHAIENNKLAHAYLFCGPRGVGKTSCARIFAKTINCLNPTADGEACNECESCKAFNEQRSYNIHELDAASNNSVDDIRQLIEQVRIPPQIGRYKVFIIDEVHMLSSQAFNAFLKTLEEPPHHALFILATTEKHKVLPTILSRCQTYDFSRITISDIVEHLQYVASRENIKAEPEALNVIAQKADGGMRDALSLFDQAANYTNGNITYQAIIENLNVLDYDYFFRMTDFILNGNIRGALLLLNEILNKGFDGQNIISGLASHFRDLLVCQDEETIVLFEVGSSIKGKYKDMAKRCPENVLLKALELANNCDLNYKASRNKRLLIELTLIQICQLNKHSEEEKKKTIIEPIGTAQEIANNAQTTVAKQQTEKTVVTHVPTNIQNPVTHNLTQPTVPPATKRAARPPMGGTSLKDLGVKKKNIAGDSVSASVAMPEQNNNFTETELINAWENLANSIDEKVFLKNTMLSCKPKLLDNFYFEIAVHNPPQQEELINSAIDILSVLRSKLGNSHIQMKVRVQETNEKHLAYTAAEKLELLMTINPTLGKLKNEFDLRVD